MSVTTLNNIGLFSPRNSLSLSYAFIWQKMKEREEKKEKEGSTMPRGHCAELTHSILFPGILDKIREIIQWYYCELFLLELVNVIMLI